MMTRAEFNRSSSNTNIVLVNWKGATDTRRCLESLSKCLDSSFCVTVVDNSQNLDGIREVCSGFNFVNYYDAGGNVGFADGCNAGAKLNASCEYVLLLNNDTEVEPDFLSPLLLLLQSNEEIAACSATIYYGDKRNSVWFAGSSIDPSSGSAIHSLPSSNSVSIVPWLTGCCILIRKAIYEELGGLNRNYFTYWEDVDLSLRLIRMGYRLAVVSESRIYHYVSSSSMKVSNATTYYYWRNRLWLVRDHLDVFEKKSLLLVVVDLFRHCFRDTKRTFSVTLIGCYIRALLSGLICSKKFINR